MKISQRDRRAMIVFGAVLVVAVAVFLLMTGGKGGGAGASTTPVTRSSPAPGSPFDQTSPSPTPTPAPQPRAAVVYSGRDPFQPVGQVGSVTPQTSPSPSSSPAPTVSPAGTPPPSSNDGSSTTIDGHTVLLDSLFTSGGEQKAQVEVDGTVYTVAEGETFAGTFKLVSVSGTTAHFLYGDQAFSLTVSSQTGS